MNQNTMMCDKVFSGHILVAFLSIMAHGIGFAQVLSCPELSIPSDGATEVPIDIDLEWSAVPGATGYIVKIGTTSGGDDILNLEGLVFENILNLASDLPSSSDIYVSIFPFNKSGINLECSEFQFTTGGLEDGLVNICTTLVDPVNGANGVLTSTVIRWLPEAEALGYLVTIGTSSGGNDILNNYDSRNQTFYQLSDDLPKGAEIYVMIIPYTAEGPSEGCHEMSFTTKDQTSLEYAIVIPKFFTPNGDGANDEWKVDAQENSAILQVLVFDRFGLLLEQMTPFQSWDGTFNGTRLPSGSYWYTIQFSDAPQQRGFFALKR